MTIPSQDGREEQPSDDSYNPFSVLSVETTKENSKTDFDDPEAPAKDTEIATSAFSDTIYYEYPLQDYSDCPLLQEVSVDRLPSQFIDLLDGRGEGPPGKVEFYPGYIPSHPCVYALVASPFATAFVGVSVSLAKEVPMHGMNGGVAIGCIFAFVFASILIFACAGAYGAHEKRKALFAKNSEGNPKPWPGDWKGGVYTTQLALLEFDGKDKAWLFPVDSIVKVEAFKLHNRNSKPQTILWLKSPPDEEAFQYEIKNLDQPSRGKEIQRWHKCATSTRGRNHYGNGTEEQNTLSDNK